MAIKERKIQSPSEIKSTPQAFSQEELNQLIALRDDINKLTFQFGQIQMTKIKLKRDEDMLQENLTSLEKEEKILAKKLSDKYGDGSIDLESGSFIPSK